MKIPVVSLVLAMSLLISGCFRISTGHGVVYYQATSLESVRALRSRIEPLRDLLRSDRRFVEEVGSSTLEFQGAPAGEFKGSRIAFNRDERDVSKDSQAVLVVGCPHSIAFSMQARELRQIVEKSLGPDVVRLLKISSDEGLMDVR